MLRGPTPHRQSRHGTPLPGTRTPTGASLAFRFGAPIFVLVLLATLWILGAASLCFIPRAQQVTTFQKSFSVPLFPITPALGLLVNIHLFCSLGVATHACFAAWTGLGALVYCLYGVHAAAAAEEAGEVELTRWGPGVHVLEGLRSLVAPGNGLCLGMASLLGNVCWKSH